MCHNPSSAWQALKTQRPRRATTRNLPLRIVVFQLSLSANVPCRTGFYASSSGSSPICLLRTHDWPGNIPRRGGALLVCNHMSFVDAVMLLAAARRPIRFLIFKDIYDLPLIKPFAKMVRAIPISSELRPRDMIRSLREATEADSSRRVGLHLRRRPDHAHRPDAAVPPGHGTHHERRRMRPSFR